ncbi:hypothetical protein [Leptolyngbya sp. CCY15150]|uniref:hypothetical protein n=1 Tax=Leptolyngbya sp. CCY15150 TaxID=2767772 RepID=UPI0019518B6F|nr:hypothetical protein [Leptolyngbya sp. CCY15150]
MAAFNPNIVLYSNTHLANPLRQEHQWVTSREYTEYQDKYELFLGVPSRNFDEDVLTITPALPSPHNYPCSAREAIAPLALHG